MDVKYLLRLVDGVANRHLFCIDFAWTEFRDKKGTDKRAITRQANNGEVQDDVVVTSGQIRDLEMEMEVHDVYRREI
ncbi:hypothetical protein TorRG33x02_005990 [Trema orientale]|uniref:Uncharacterized protein n=1 Tax=Trema orientale TaxID=63057 RepID=A0A2P5G028_TREOI|nr:hypothetical protein TorRG33x02_005990 [Trema orientale]